MIDAVNGPTARWAAVEGGTVFSAAGVWPLPAFLAVHRDTRLVLAAGRVTDPEPYREDDL
ncbi:hypothetical protein [Streptomyces sp. NPDC001536]|uniref:hypothetical protein n=1 Tax=Streptomyces sp. NPDC001536 TaxID=3364583 RepID=UPI00369D3B2F